MGDGQVDSWMVGEDNSRFFRDQTNSTPLSLIANRTPAMVIAHGGASFMSAQFP